MGTSGEFRTRPRGGSGPQFRPGAKPHTRSVAAEPPRQLDVEDLEVDVADTLEQCSAVLESAKASGSWSRHASYSTCRVRNWSTASAHRFGRGQRPVNGPGSAMVPGCRPRAAPALSVYRGGSSRGRRPLQLVSPAAAAVSPTGGTGRCPLPSSWAKSPTR